MASRRSGFPCPRQRRGRPVHPTRDRPSALPRVDPRPALHAVEPVREHFLPVGEADEVVRDEAEIGDLLDLSRERGGRRLGRPRGQADPLRADEHGHRGAHPEPARVARAHDADAGDRHVRPALAEALDPAREDIGRADELHHEAVGGVAVDLRRRADLQDAAPIHHRDAVGHGERLVLVVGHVHEGDPDPALQPRELGLHLLAQLEIEGAERLVEQEHRRLVDQGARQRHPLALPAAELARPPLLEPLERDQAEHLLHRAPPLGPRHLLHAQAEPHVVGHAHVREQRVALEDGVHGPRVRRRVAHRLPVDQERAAGGGLEAADQVEGGGLAAAARSQQREELTLADLEVDAVQRHHGAEALAHIAQLDRKARHLLRPSDPSATPAIIEPASARCRPAPLAPRRKGVRESRHASGRAVSREPPRRARRVPRRRARRRRDPPSRLRGVGPAHRGAVRRGRGGARRHHLCRSGHRQDGSARCG